MPTEGWPEVAELLTASGKPWPESAAVYDLRWHQATSSRRLSGRGFWRARWHWSDWEVRSLLRTPERWADPLSQTPPKPTSSQTEEPGKPLGVLPSSPEPLHTRVDLQDKTERTSGEWSPRVVGASDRQTFDEARPEVAELLAMQRRDGNELFAVAQKDVRALLHSLRSGLSVDWHRRLMEAAHRKNIAHAVWSTVLGERMAWLRDLAGPDDPPPMSETPQPPRRALPLRRPGEW